GLRLAYFNRASTRWFARDTGSMTLIEWTRLAGDTVEALVALLVNVEHPTSVRITPSRGDGGVDILHRDGAGEGRDVVYQVKRYTEPVAAREKVEIQQSLTRLSSDSRWNDLNVTHWRLVMPWNP